MRVYELLGDAMHAVEQRDPKTAMICIRCASEKIEQEMCWIMEDWRTANRRGT
jgi:hypothetical protein